MRYMIAYYETPDEFAARVDPARSQPYWASWSAYMGAMSAAGIMLGGHGLQPPATATTLRLRDDKRRIEDGPYADSKEQLAGFVVLSVPHLDAALDWAARAPCAATGAVEIRPILEMGA
jgi:hypothetical protein